MTSCPEPAGGWAIVDDTKVGYEDQDAVFAAAVPASGVRRLVRRPDQPDGDRAARRGGGTRPRRSSTCWSPRTCPAPSRRCARSGAGRSAWPRRGTPSRSCCRSRRGCVTSPACSAADTERPGHRPGGLGRRRTPGLGGRDLRRRPGAGQLRPAAGRLDLLGVLQHGLEGQTDRVDAVAIAGRGAVPVGKDVPQM